MQASVNEDRNKYVGGSDIPIIMGISPFKTRYDLLLEKAELKENNFDGNEYTEYGNVMEEKIRNYVNEYLERNFEEGQHFIGEDIRCHTDGEDDKAVIEIKTTSQVHEFVNEYKHYLVQLLFYMVNTQKEQGFLCVYDRPKDFNEEFDKDRLQIFEIQASDYTDLVKDIFDAVDLFRIDLQRLKDNPMLSEEDLLPVDISDISAKLAIIEDKLKEYDNLVAEQKILKSKLKKAMEEHGIKKWTTNDGTQITLVPDGEDKIVQKFNAEALKEENPDMYNAYLEDVIQKGKAGYVKITYPKGEK